MPKHSAKDVLILVFFAVIFLTRPNFVCAEQQALTEFQNQARAYRDQGWQFQQEGNIEAALSYYQKAIALDPNYPVVYNDIGVILESRGDIEEARLLYLKAVEIDPNYPNSYSNLALLYEAEGDYANSILNWVKRATVGDPQDPWTQAARKRLEDIARTHPEAYRAVGEDRVTLFNRENNTVDVNLDSGAGATEYLRRAKESFSKGDYVTALKEATLAEYLDSSNAEVSAFVKKVRRTLLP